MAIRPTVAGGGEAFPQAAGAGDEVEDGNGQESSVQSREPEVRGRSSIPAESGSPDDVLRDAVDALRRDDEDLAAVEEAIAEWRAGDEGVPLDEAFAALRTRAGR